MQKLNSNFGESKNIKKENIETLKALFPEIVTEGKIDVDVFKQLFTDEIEDRQERYSFTWNGKSKARKLAMTPSRGTLRPVPEESVNWDSTENLYIEGDNLEVLKLLQRSYHGKVKLIYIDPPYNTGNDFVYNDDYKDNIKNYLQVSGQLDEEGVKVSTNPEYSGRYHTDWLNMIFPRLKLARELLSDDGVIFISIDENEVSNLRKVCDEIFGEENFKSNIAWEKRYTRSNNTIDFTTVIEYILVYSKSEDFQVNLLQRTDEADSRYSNPDNDPRGAWKGASFLNPASPDERPNLCYPIENPNTGKVTHPDKHAWRRSKEVYEKLQDENRLYWGQDGKSSVPAIKMFLSEARGLTPINLWKHDYAGNTDEGTKELQELGLERVFNNPKPSKLIRRILEHGSNENSLVLDFFSGSSSTAQAVIEQNISDGGNRKFIMVQLPETVDKKSEAYKAGYHTIAEIGKDRIRKVIKKVEEYSDGYSIKNGFKVFKLNTSNLKPWDPTFDEVQLSIEDSVENIKPDRSEYDVLYEILLKYGLNLSLPIEEREIAESKVFVAGAGALFICLAPNIDLEVVEGIANLKEKLEPELTRVVFRDSGFKDDVVKTNAVQTLKQHGIEDVRSI